MDVSNFELIFEPQPPVPPADTVLQGYFLGITNLEEVDLTFQLEGVTSPANAPTRTLANNTLAIVDAAGAQRSPFPAEWRPT